MIPPVIPPQFDVNLLFDIFIGSFFCGLITLVHKIKSSFFLSSILFIRFLVRWLVLRAKILNLTEEHDSPVLLVKYHCFAQDLSLAD